MVNRKLIYILIAFPLVGFLLIPCLWGILFFGFIGHSYYLRHDHQEFAAKGVSQIEPAMQMDQIYSDCRHFITYGKENVPLFNSVAYFGDRYELTMQVPVEIRSETSGSMIGEAQFYLNEVRAVDIPPSQIGASFSGGIEFGSTKWQQVYKADGDFGVIGFKINTVPVPVANFKVYSAASRPSN